MGWGEGGRRVLQLYKFNFFFPRLVQTFNNPAYPTGLLLELRRKAVSINRRNRNEGTKNILQEINKFIAVSNSQRAITISETVEDAGLNLFAISGRKTYHSKLPQKK